MNENDVLRDPSTSAWLREALRTALDCDPVTVANEAEFLVSLLHRRIVRLAQIEALETDGRDAAAVVPGLLAGSQNRRRAKAP